MGGRVGIGVGRFDGVGVGAGVGFAVGLGAAVGPCVGLGVGMLAGGRVGRLKPFII